MDGSRELKWIVRIQKYGRLRLIKSYPNQGSEAKTKFCFLNTEAGDLGG